MLTPIHTPDADVYAERCMRSIRSERRDPLIQEVPSQAVSAAQELGDRREACPGAPGALLEAP